MFKIELVDIGGDGLIGECNVPVDTLPEAEILAREQIRKALQTYDVQLIHNEELLYEVISGGCSVGVVQITTL